MINKEIELVTTATKIPQKKAQDQITSLVKIIKQKVLIKN